MHTDNLQEMIKADVKEETFKGLTSNSLTWDEKKKDDFSTVVSENQSREPRKEYGR